MIWMEFVFLFMSWENVYVRQRKNKNVNLHLEFLVSRQIDCERKAWTKTGKSVTLLCEWTTNCE